MTEYISRESALINCPNVAHDAIKAIPSADVVERKTGRWMRTPTFWVYCSVCDREPPNETNEITPCCPWCGAKMENYEQG